MRIRIAHETIYRYETPATKAIQILRVSPRNHDGQYVVRWRVEVSEDCRVEPREDAFGNLTHTFTVDGPISELGGARRRRSRNAGHATASSAARAKNFRRHFICGRPISPHPIRL